MQRERGGILAAVVIGVVLTALLAGAIVASKGQGRQASTSPAVSVKTDNKPSDTQKQPSQSDQNKNNSTTKDTTPPKDNSSTSNNPSTQQPKPSAPQSGQSSQSPSTQQQNQVANTGPGNIATTGPTDVIFTAIALAALTAAIAAYRRSYTHMVARALR